MKFDHVLKSAIGILAVAAPIVSTVFPPTAPFVAAAGVILGAIVGLFHTTPNHE